jgi:hypothetical protein
MAQRYVTNRSLRQITRYLKKGHSLGFACKLCVPPVSANAASRAIHRSREIRDEIILARKAAAVR